MNLLNETSWPALGGNGLLGSETPSAVVEVDPAADAPLDAPVPAAVEEPSRVGGASGVEPAAVVVVAGGVEDEVLAVCDFIIFIVRGTWKANSASRNTPPTARKTFCRLAFALGSFFFFAISSSLRPSSSPRRSRARESWWLRSSSRASSSQAW